MKMLKVMFVFLMLMTVASSALAQPTAQEVSSQMKQYWQNKQFDELETYIDALYQDYPNYIPAVLAKNFYHSVYRNHPTDALIGLNRVKEATESNPELGTQEFRETLVWVIGILEGFTRACEEAGTTQEELDAEISVESVWETWSDYSLMPDFILIDMAPDESI